MFVEFPPFNAIGDHAGTTTAGTVTLTKPAGARELMIQVLTQNARYCYGTVAPSATIGFQLAAGAAPVIIKLWLGTAIQLCAESGTASIQYQWGG